MARVFLYKGQKFNDPGAEFSNEDVLRLMSAHLPELANGEIVTSDEQDGVAVVEFRPKPKRLG